ncbi:MAG: ABC transporter permease [Bacteroidota bacterium]|nr:ABC transporter permease [Bacteroidota bacterium]
MLRKALVVVQFSISVVLMIGTLVVFNQIDFMKNKDLGFKKDNLLALPMPLWDTTFAPHLAAFRQELQRNAAFESIATTNELPGEKFGKLMFVIRKDGAVTEKALHFLFADHDLKDVLGLKLSEGRYFDKELQTDYTAAFVINEAAAKSLGWKHSIGQELENGFGMNGKVVGVVKNFHFASLDSPVEPLVIMLPMQKTGRNLLARISTGQSAAALAHLEKTFKAFAPRHPFEYIFVDQNFEKAYRKEEKMLTIFGYFAALTIFIACLGLFGLAAYTTAQRTKEIGIRKVNGASVSDISIIFIRDFAKLVALALVVAWPLAYFLMTRWLEDFAFRVPLSVSSFALAGLLAMLIALLTVSFHAVRAALSDPIKALRYE